MPPMATTHHHTEPPVIDANALLAMYSEQLQALGEELRSVRQKLAGVVPLNLAVGYRRRADRAEADADRLAHAISVVMILDRTEADTPPIMRDALARHRQALLERAPSDAIFVDDAADELVGSDR
jgi:hypothetical protein